MRPKKSLLVLLAGLVGLACAIALTLSIPISAQEPLSLGLPVQCDLDSDCFILQYTDRDPGPAAVDFGCGRMTGDGHKGTDFAIADEVTMAEGVPVIAATDGRVLRVRDGVPDRRVVTDSDLAAVEDMECGNGIVVDSGNGWETQYCHLRQGSVAVRAGDEIAKGDRLGFIGESGLASFPHVHLGVRYEGEVIDPFVGFNRDADCGDTTGALWDVPLEYRPTGLVRAGFAPEIPDLDRLWAGDFRSDRLSVDSDALLFWVHVYGVLDGDEVTIELLDPNGNVAAEGSEVLESLRISFRVVGLRLPAGGGSTAVAAGERWRGRYRLTRSGETIVAVEREVTLF